MATRKTTAGKQPKPPQKVRSAEPARQEKKKEKSSQRKLVVIRCKGRRVAAAPVFNKSELQKTGTTLEEYQVSSSKELNEAFGRLEDGDILVLNAHSNQNLFAYQDGGKEKRVNWGDLWKHVGRKTPPRLAGTILAGCTVPKDTLDRKKLRDIRKVLNSTIFAAPYASAKYEVSPCGDIDNEIARDMGMAIAKFYAGRINKADLTENLFGKQERFGVVYGCNGYNHPLGCGCGFGAPHLNMPGSK
ncbi:MAG: hypothetical protein HPY61_13720 [Methanotrichaceae archaeon]|nr:hypothetical protein [Methanotrichaceae archaeon]